MASNDGVHDEQQKNDLLAALASARELGPDMDKAVAASYLEKQKQQATAQTQAQEPQQQQTAVVSRDQRPPWAIMTPALGVILFVAILVASGGHAWWMFWLIFCFGGFGWWGWRGDAHQARMQRRMDRYEWRRTRYGYRYGPYDRYGDGSGSGPATAQQPPQVQPPQQAPGTQQPQPPIEYD